MGLAVHTLMRISSEDVAFYALERFLTKSKSSKPNQQTLDNLLIFATNRLFVRCMKLLLEHGANASSEIPELRLSLVTHTINKRSEKGDEACKLLISYNASTDYPGYWARHDNDKSNNVLALALLRQRTQVVEALLRAGCSPNLTVMIEKWYGDPDDGYRIKTSRAILYSTSPAMKRLIC
jgi:ankyrin repeat protein